MNDARRKIINQAVSLLENAQGLLTHARDEELEAFDNLTESLQEGEKGQAMSGNVDLLSEVLDALSEQEDRLGEIE